jgi:hypothetical protein
MTVPTSAVALADSRMGRNGRSGTVHDLIVFALLLAVLAGVHFIVAANAGVTKSAAQAAVFQWWFLGIVAASGTFGAAFIQAARLPGMWDAAILAGEKLIAPLVAGIIIGIAYAIGDAQTGFSVLVAAKMHLGSIHIAWPMSLPIYLGGAILVSILYFLVLIPPLNWLIGRVLLKERYSAAVYGLTAAPLALAEPLTQGDIPSVAAMGWTAVPNLAGDLAVNLAQVWFLRRAGFVACVAVRAGFYGVWHIVYPLLPL